MARAASGEGAPGNFLMVATPKSPRMAHSGGEIHLKRQIKN